MITNDIDDAFFRALPRVCKAIGCKPIDLLGVMFSESGVRPAALNPHGGASGLIQFMPATLAGLGWKLSTQDFRCLSASGQLPYVAAYFAPWMRVGAPFDTAARIYQAIFLPGTLGKVKDPDGVLCARGGSLGWAFTANAVFDANGDGRITLGELGDAVKRNARGPRWREICERAGIESGPFDLSDGIDSVEEVQRALQALGFDPGPIDGIPGPKTAAAVRAFQAGHGLHEDGRAGPATRAALEHALATPPPERPTTPEIPITPSGDDE